MAVFYCPKRQVNDSIKGAAVARVERGFGEWRGDRDREER
jgi:hypothetical protein